MLVGIPHVQEEEARLDEHRRDILPAVIGRGRSDRGGRGRDLAVVLVDVQGCVDGGGEGDLARPLRLLLGLLRDAGLT